MQNRIKALFFDIDGTLVSFAEHRIPDSAVDAIRKAKVNGLKIIISTGRPPAIITNLGQIEDLIDGYITFNGGVVTIGEQTIHHNPIHAEDVEMIKREAMSRDYCVLLSSKDKMVVLNHKPVFDDIFVEGLGVDTVDINEPHTVLDGHEIYEMTPFLDATLEQAVLPQMTHSISARWHPAFVDITAKGADKGAGLQIAARHLGISPTECMSFGDGENDITILKAAGIGVAMGNASDEVKAQADFVTKHIDEDGISNALKHFEII